MELNAPTVLGAGGMLLSVALSNNSPSQDTLNATSNNTTLNQVAIEMSTEALQASDQLAKTRFQSNLCIRSTVPLTPGMAVDSHLQGQVVCDAFGNTAQVAPDGRLVMFARTGDSDIITGGLQ